MVQNMQLFELSQEPREGCFGQTVRVGFSHPFIYLLMFPLAQVARHHRVPTCVRPAKRSSLPWEDRLRGRGDGISLGSSVTRGQISM